MRRLVLVAIAAVGLAVTYYGWLRDSSLVAVHAVRVEGAEGPDRARIVAALTEAGERMTTLHVQADRLEAAVRSFPAVASVSADAGFPHSLTVHVRERRPTVIVRSGDRAVPAAGDGTLLPGVDAPGGLPELRVDAVPQDGRLSGDPLQETLVGGAAPEPLRPLIDDISMDADYGVVITLHGGIELRFGTAQSARAKWEAAAAVLADRAITSLSYLDVRVPDRPAASGV